MKFKHFYKILIILTLTVFISSCSKQIKEFNLNQDGFFTVFLNAKETNETKFESGTKLILKVKEDLVEENEMIDEVIINGVSHQAMYQYNITMDKNINISVKFKEIPIGLARLSLTGEYIKVTPEAIDNVYTLGTTITFNAPDYYQFIYIYIDDEKVEINDITYQFKVEQITRIHVEMAGLKKTHDQITISSPPDLEVSILNESPDNYYLIGSEVTFVSPENYSFTGSIEIGNETYLLNGNKFTTIVIEEMNVEFGLENILVNSFTLELPEGIEVVGDKQNLYAHGSKIFVKAINNYGMDMIDTLTINGEEIEVNEVIYEITIEGDTKIEATFKLYDKDFINYEATTADYFDFDKTGKVFSKQININVFIIDNDDSKSLLFLKDGIYQVRIDLNDEYLFYKFDIKYEIQDLKINKDGFGFIYKDEKILVGSSNDYSLELEVKAIIPNLEEPSTYLYTTYVVRSNQVGNIDYILEQNGKDVTDLYLELSLNGLSFLEEAIGQNFDLILKVDGIEIIQPIQVVKGYNIINSQDLVLNEVNLLQGNITFHNTLEIEDGFSLIGNYHSVYFNIEGLNLIEAINVEAIIKNTMIKSLKQSQTGIEINNSILLLENIVIENVLYGIHAINSDLTIKKSKFQNIKEINLIIVNDHLVEENISLTITLFENVFSKTNNFSILIVDLNLENETNLNANPLVVLNNNQFKNIKIDEDLDEEIVNFLESVNPLWVDVLTNEYNLAIYLDGGLVYSIYFDCEIINEFPTWEYEYN